MPKVSIITPCYNGEKYLSQTIESVLDQTLTDWEMIVVDDGSTDRSAEIAGGYAAGDTRIRLIRQENRGVNAARNAGFGASPASATYLLFLDADDMLDPVMLATLTAYMDERPDAAMAYCAYARVDENDVELPAEDRPPLLAAVNGRLAPLGPDDREIPFDTMLWWLYLPPSSSLMRRDVYERLPGWDEDFEHGCEDTDLLLRFALSGQVHSLPQRLLHYRTHAGQATKRGWFMKRQRGVLHNKWLNGVGLTDEEANRFREQWALYEGSLIPRHLLGEAVSQLAKGRLARSAKLAVRSAAHLAISRTAGCRRFVWPYLWYLA